MTPPSESRIPSGLEAAWLIGRLAMSELARARLLPVVGLVAVGLALGAVALRDLHLGAAELRLILDLGFGAAGLGGTVLAVLGTTQLVLGDLERRTVALVWVRPVSRSAWLAGKLVGVCAVLAVYVALVMGVTLAVASNRAGALGLGVPVGEIVLGGAMLGVRSAVIAAGTLLVCAIARTALWANGVAAVGVLIGHLRAVVAGAPWEFSWEGIGAALVRAWPNLQVFEPAAVPPGSVGMVAAYGGVYLALFTVAAAWVFRYREL